MKTQLLPILLVLSIHLSAAVKTWVGPSGSNWTNASSWSPSGVPVSTDDIVFNASSTVEFTAGVNAVKSLTVTNSCSVIFNSLNGIIFGEVAGAPLTIDAGATLGIRNVRLELNGASLVNGTLNMISWSNAQVKLFAQALSTATITINGTVRVGTEKINGLDYDAGGLFGTGSPTSVIFNSGSLYEVARNSGQSGITNATWAPDATLKITGATSTSGYGLAWNSPFSHEIGNFIWDCPNQGAVSNIAFGIYPYVSKVKGNFIVNNTNGKALRFTSSANGSYTSVFEGDFLVNTASTVLELFSSSASANASALAILKFGKNVSCLAQISTGANTSKTHKLIFNGSLTGLNGTGSQLVGFAGFARDWAFSLEVNNNQNGISLTGPLGKIRDIQLSSHVFLGNYNLTAGGDGGNLIGSYSVVTNGTGSLVVPIAAGDTRLIPVAESDQSNDAITIIPANNDTFAVRVKSTFSNAVADITKVYDREWNIVSNSTNATVEFRPCYCATAPTETGDYVIGHFKNGAWTEVASTETNVFKGIFNSFSPFAVGIAGGFSGTSTTTTYTFNGDGNWSDATNWSNNTKPPSTIGSGMKVIIDPPVNGSCILDVPVTIASGGNISVNPGKVFKINGNLIIQ